jgi:hypothetical protein
MRIGEDDPTPAASDAATALANAALALATAATRLAAASELVESVAGRCAEAARVVDAYDGPDREQLLAGLEDELGHLAEAIHDTRRAMRKARLRMKGETPP